MIETNSISITEDALLYQVECPLRSNGLASLPESPVLSCSKSTCRWLISEIAVGRQPTANQTREYYDWAWQRTKFFQSRDIIPQKDYNRHLIEGVRACSRLREIIWKSEILRPVSPYELTIDGTGITGEYAVLRSSHRKRQASVLYLRYGGIKIRPIIPDIVSFARWLHVSNLSEAREWGLDRIGVKHYWVSQYLAADHHPEQSLAVGVVHGAIGVVSRPAFPVVGEHCLSCPTRTCNPSTSAARALCPDEPSILL